MQVIKSTRIVYVDVDDTLVFSPREDTDLPLLPGYKEVTVRGIKWFAHVGHINMLKDFKGRGHTVVVWSQGGVEWAEMVVKALLLEDKVDLVIDKPDWYIDDKPVTYWLGEDRQRYMGKEYK